MTDDVPAASAADRPSAPVDPTVANAGQADGHLSRTLAPRQDEENEGREHAESGHSVSVAGVREPAGLYPGPDGFLPDPFDNAFAAVAGPENADIVADAGSDLVRSPLAGPVSGIDAGRDECVASIPAAPDAEAERSRANMNTAWVLHDAGDEPASRDDTRGAPDDTGAAADRTVDGTVGHTTSDPSSPRASASEDAAALRARCARLIVEIDALIGRQLDAVLHHPALQRLEALWRGTWWLVESNADPQVKVRILDARWAEIARDMERAIGFDQTVLFEKIYSGEFGTPGGEPFGMMVVDHALWHRPSGREKVDDIACLSSLAEVAAAAFCPIVLGVDPRLIALDGYEEVDLRQDVSGALSGAEFTRFDRLRAQSDCRFLAAVLPRMLMRAPHRGRAFPRLGFVYDEAVEDGRDLLWATGGFGLAQVAARAMREHRWPAAIRGASGEQEGGVVPAPSRLFLPSDRGGTVARFATENAISEEQEMALNAAGLICLRQLHLTGTVAFLNLPTLHRPPDYDSEVARMNAKMGAMLNYIMCVCRFAHYIKVIGRDWVGKYSDAHECEGILQNWLNQYTTGNDDASPEMRVRYPLRQAAVAVAEVPGKPGTYTCEIAIRPHYQLDQIASEFRLVTAIGREVAV